MADVLKISTAVDLTGVQSGMPKAAAAVEENIQRMTAAMKAMEAESASLRAEVTALQAKLADGMHHTTSETQEAQHAMRELGQEIGVHIPRGISRWLSSMGPVAGVMSAAFAPIMVIALVEVLSEIPKKVGEALDAMGGFGEETKKLYKDLIEANDKWIMVNLRAEDDIDKARTAGLSGTKKIRQEIDDNTASQKRFGKELGDSIRQLNAANAEVEKYEYTVKNVLTSWSGIVREEKLARAKDDRDRLQKKVDELTAETRKRETIEPKRLAIEGGQEAQNEERERAKQRLDDYKKNALARVDLAESAAKQAYTLSTASLEQEIAAEQTAAALRYKIELDSAHRTNELRAQERALGKVAPDIDTSELATAYQRKAMEITTRGIQERNHLAEEAALAQGRADELVVNAQVAGRDQAGKRLIADNKSQITEEMDALKSAEATKYNQQKSTLEGELRVAVEGGDQKAAAVIAAQGKLEELEITHKNRLIEIDADADSKRDDLERRRLDLEKMLAAEQIAHATMVYERNKVQVQEDFDQKRITTLQKIDLLKQLEAQEYKTQMAAASKEYGAEVQKGKTDPSGNPQGIAEAQAKMQQVADKYGVTMAQLGAETQKATISSAKVAHQYMEDVSGAFLKGFDQWIGGHKKFAAAMAESFRGMADQFIIQLLRMQVQRLIFDAINKTSAEKDALIQAKVSAVHAFKSVMAAVPFPVNIVLAPVTAAAVFAGAMAFATFEQGGLHPRTEMALVHGGESTYTEKQTTRIESALSSGGGSRGGDTHYHAAPGETSDSIRRNTAELQRWVRDGRLRLA
jgi:hypothetical protein